VGALDLAVESRGRLDLDVADPGIKDVVVEVRLELGAVVGLDHLNGERELLEHVVDELDRCLLVEPVVVTSMRLESDFPCPSGARMGSGSQGMIRQARDRG
jgi:hypothetical protein